ncbi:ZP domain-containing protein-like [Actinia tenebrosa]|uniref:ZP domain-containing protein-like n=1 Tax=Actinia tenebrosa TaxID=6105 RepID=A0A6P8H0E9_ACTTE|nr:ZP domain-containing protein-like [Actinia tenebrosa]
MKLKKLLIFGWIVSCIVWSKVSSELAVEETDGLIVHCAPQYMELHVSRARFFFLDPQTFHFNGTDCKAYYINSTHVIMRTPLSGCNTRLTSNEDLLTFFASVDTEVFRTGSPISRYPSYFYMFECSYYRTFRMTLNAFSTVGKIVTRPKVKLGNFSFHMTMFQTSKYFSPYTRFPVRVRVGERVYLKVKVLTNTTGLTLFLDRCKATPSPDPNHEQSYYVLMNGCPTDQTLNYKFSIDQEQRFSFEAFRFTQSKDSSQVYLHCEAIVCHKDNNASRCNQACSKSDRPRYLTKRDITTRETEEVIMDDNLTSLLNMTSKIYDVSLGPLKVYIDPIRKGPLVQESARREGSGSRHSPTLVLFFISFILLRICS